MRGTIFLFAALALTGCAENGEIGFKNHPLDCALGYAHSDCLPGTAGYSNGIGSGLKNEEYVSAYKRTKPENSDAQQTPPLTLKETVKSCLDLVQEKWGGTFDAYVRPDGEVVDLGFPEQDFHFTKCMNENGYSTPSK